MDFSSLFLVNLDSSSEIKSKYNFIEFSVGEKNSCSIVEVEYQDDIWWFCTYYLLLVDIVPI